MSNDNDLVSRHEDTALKSDKLKLDTEIKKQNQKSDYVLGSISYIATEYDDFSKNLKLLGKQNQNSIEEINCLNKRVEEI